MQLTGLIHRERLMDLTTRWFQDRLQPGDGRFLTQLSHYESLVTAPVVIDLLVGIQRVVHRGPMHLARLQTKDQLREALLRSCPDPSPREAELFSRYREYPDEFFPGTPGDLVLGLRDDGSIVGMARVKRLKRLAEKGSRRVTHHLEGRIREQAKAHAARRAAERAVPLDHLISSDAEMAEDFYAAERLVAQSFRDGSLSFHPADLKVDDVIGIKVICSTEDMARVEQAIRSHPLVVGVEREVHQGHYNDINLVAELALPPVDEIIDRERHRDWSTCSRRGLTPAELAEGFPDYVASGARTFCAEVILTTRQDLVESEFGSSIHESRILGQRKGLSAGGRIASNASFLFEYMFMLALSPTVEIHALPVKMWGRYLPDVYSIAVMELFGLSVGRDQVDFLFPGNPVECHGDAHLPVSEVCPCSGI